MSMKFKLLAGRFVDGKTTYFPGETVTADRRLDEVFKNKFELVGEVEAEDVADEEVEEAPKRKAKKKSTKKVTYKVKKIGKNKYDVISSKKKKPINDEYLTKKEAEALAESMKG